MFEILKNTLAWSERWKYSNGVAVLKSRWTEWRMQRSWKICE